MFAVRPICVQNSIFKMSGTSPENITYCTKKTLKLVAKILATKFGFVPDCLHAHWACGSENLRALQKFSCAHPIFVQNPVKLMFTAGKISMCPD